MTYSCCRHRHRHFTFSRCEHDHSCRCVTERASMKVSTRCEANKQLMPTESRCPLPSRLRYKIAWHTLSTARSLDQHDGRFTEADTRLRIVIADARRSRWYSDTCSNRHCGKKDRRKKRTAAVSVLPNGCEKRHAFAKPPRRVLKLCPASPPGAAGVWRLLHSRTALALPA